MFFSQIQWFSAKFSGFLAQWWYWPSGGTGPVVVLAQWWYWPSGEILVPVVVKHPVVVKKPVFVVKHPLGKTRLCGKTPV